MSENLKDNKKQGCNILVVAVGGAGCNAANNMVTKGIEKVDILVTNTDFQVFEVSKVERKLLLGKTGLGAGSDPTIGAAAARESLKEFVEIIENYDMIFFTAGMGGGTGTGAANVLAQAAKDLGKLVVAVVTKPFIFEGGERKRIAENGIEELKNNVDTLIVIPNQNLFKIAGARTSFVEAFQKADEVLYQTVAGITNLIRSIGLVNLDYADVKSVMKDKGFALVGFGNNTKTNEFFKIGDDKIDGEFHSGNPIQIASIEDTVIAAMNHPLLDEKLDIASAEALLLNITGGKDVGLSDVDIISRRIHQKIRNKNAHILIGTIINENMKADEVEVLIVATGLKPSTNIIENENLIDDENYIQLGNYNNLEGENLENNENYNESQKDVDLDDPYYNGENDENDFESEDNDYRKTKSEKKKSFFSSIWGFVTGKKEKKTFNSNDYDDSVIDFLYNDKKPSQQGHKNKEESSVKNKISNEKNNATKNNNRFPNKPRSNK